MAAAVALENLRILEEEKIVQRVHDNTGPYLTEAWARLADHPLVGEAVNRGLMASIALTPDKARRAPFAAPVGTAGLIARERCFANNLVMRHVGDRMIISPPLIISRDDIDEVIARAARALDETLEILHRRNLMTAAAA